LKKKKKFIDVILGKEGEFSLQERIYNSLFFISALLLVVFFITDILQESDFKIYIASLTGSIFFVSLYFLSRKLKIYKPLIHLFNFIIVVAFVYLWYYGGGLNGVALIIMVPMLGVIPVFVNGFNRIFGVAFLTAISITLLIIEIHNPDFVQFTEHKQIFLIDKFVTALLISFSILGVVFLILHGYNKEHQKVVELNKSKDKLLSIIAHDLKNPVGTLNKLTNLLLERHDKFDSNRRAAIISSMVESTEGTYNLLENLLMWARSESGNIELKKENIKVKELIENSVLLLKESANQKKLKINLDVEEDLSIYADRNMLDTIIRNLISNSIKFSEENQEILVFAIQSIDEVEITVKDYGIGMSKSFQENLFSKEKTTSTRGTNEESGTGFGLKLCKEFARLNDGKISVNSKEGVGTEITVYIPKMS